MRYELTNYFSKRKDELTMTIDELESNLFCTLANSDGVYRIVLLNDELPNVPPNSYGTLAKRKREKVRQLLHNLLVLVLKMCSGDYFPESKS